MATNDINNVGLFDPMDVISPNNGITNTTPAYEKMFIFVELSARRRGRSVLVSNGNGTTSSLDTGMGKDIIVNMLGIDQEKKMHTTNYYLGSVPTNKTQYEGFGISNIKVVLNSSFIPQVSIEFVDIRGITFFSDANSPYRILFDFPPPLFDLTLKGYYGKALNYQLHLVKYNTKFDASSGNFIINADFVAATFAPLTDILYRYIYNSSWTESGNTKSDLPPKTTYELVEKIKSLNDDSKEKIDNSKENIRYQDAFKKVNACKDWLEQITYFGNATPVINDNDPQNILFIYDSKKVVNGTVTGELIELSSILKFNEILASHGSEFTNIDIEERLFLGTKIGKINTNSNTSNTQTTLDEKIISVNKNLTVIRKKLLDSAKITTASIYDVDVTLPTTINYNPTNVGSTNQYEKFQYQGIDVTGLYIKVYKNYLANIKEKASAQQDLVTTVNSFVLKKIGMTPTIFNIFNILCNDIDNFFNKLRKTTIDAEIHHNKPEYKNKIINSDIREPQQKLYAFPLVIKIQNVGGVKKEVRTYPKDISDSLGAGGTFPELIFLNDFIQTFFHIKQNQLVADLKKQKDDKGNNKWIPVSPLDSDFNLDNSNYESPYVFNISKSTTDTITNVVNTLINRFYVLTQNTYSNSFYSGLITNELLNFYANGEAINLANSINNDTYADQLLTFANKYNNQSNINNFYTDTNKDYSDVYNLTTTKDYIPLESDIKVYIDRKNENYSGVYIPENYVRPDIRTADKSSTNIVDKYLDDSKNWFHWVSDLVNTKTDITSKNLFFISDAKKEDSFYYTRFLEDIENNDYISPKNNLHYLNEGNVENTGIGSFLGVNNSSSFLGVNNSSSFVKQFSYILSAKDNQIINLISNYNTSNQLGAFLVVSNFGRTLSPFSRKKDINNRLFISSAIIECPKFVSIYVGGIVTALDQKKSGDPSFYNDIISFFTSSTGASISNGGRNVFADIYDVDTYLSKKDKDIFKQMFTDFFDNLFGVVSSNLLMMYDDVTTELVKTYPLGTTISEDDLSEYYDKKQSLYSDFLTKAYLDNITKNVSDYSIIVNYNQITFKESTAVFKKYRPLSEINSDKFLKDQNDKYFSTFFSKLVTELNNRKKQLVDIKEEFKKAIGDDDIWTQLYYSFKNISDKWILDLNLDVNGYPFNFDKNSKLIDKFKFVDRAMNPVGDVIVDPKLLSDLISNDDVDVNVFTLMSKLLSGAGFEFFPLQNFMSFNDPAQWQNDFCGLFETVNQPSNPAFVCMFIGGTSSRINGSINDFPDDGVDFLKDNLPDFASTQNKTDGDSNNDGQLNLNNSLPTNNQFPYKKPRAFRVRFGEQNQAIFSNLEIDSKEYPETNESLQILSRLVDKQTTTPKSQSLYNIYEKRSYKTTVSMLGDVMIQPTQYFQLENIPMFSGAYMILSIEHNITPNHMISSFTGVKILKYPVPMVKQSSAIVGVDYGSSDETNGFSTSNSAIVADLNPDNAPKEARYNSMYQLSISPLT